MKTKTKWHDHKYGGGATLDLGYGLSMWFSWAVERLPENAPSWEVTVFNNRLKGRCKEKEEAKRRAQRVAKQILGQAMEKLLEIQEQDVKDDNLQLPLED